MGCELNLQKGESIVLRAPTAPAVVEPVAADSSRFNFYGSKIPQNHPLNLK